MCACTWNESYLERPGPADRESRLQTFNGRGLERLRRPLFGVRRTLTGLPRMDAVLERIGAKVRVGLGGMELRDSVFGSTCRRLDLLGSIVYDRLSARGTWYCSIFL